MPILEMTGVEKRYGGVRALAGASLALERGEVHGLLGPNGSGKSTLNKVLAGTVAPDRARITLDGEPLAIRGPMGAHRHGIAAVYQQLSLVPQLTVGQNLVLGVEKTIAGFLAPRRSRPAVRAVLDRFAEGLGADVTERTPVSDLPPGEQQIVEIAKAVLKRPRILVLDEATASLHRDQVKLVFDVVRELTADGVSVVFVSHRLDEILEICTRATILRTGESVATVELAETDEDELVRLMVGDVAATEVRRHTPPDDAPVLLEVSGLHGEGVVDVSFQARAGEVVGLGGLQGQGQSELLLTLFGDLPIRSGTVVTEGARHRIRNPRDAARAGLALVPGDRGTQGMFPQRSIQENISVVSLPKRAWLGMVVLARREKEAASRMVESLRIKIGRLADPVSSLSGGNQQKVVLAKWLLDEPRVVLLDDPTKGVDISAKAEIYGLIRRLTDGGATVVFNSSDDRELAEVADRVLVLYEGRVRGELRGDDVSYDGLVSSALLIGMGDRDDAETAADAVETPADGEGETR